MFPFALVLAQPSEAASDIEFKSSSPVSIYVDGQQASQPNPLKHKASALDPGVHQLKVVGMFGKTLYEAEIDLPDNTITYASWERGEIKVLSTDWLKEEDDATAAADDTGTDEEELEVVEVPPPAPVEAAEAETPEPMATDAGQDAVASVDPSAGGGAGAAATTAAVAAGGVAAGMALEDANDPAVTTDSALTTAPAVETVAATTTTAPAPIARTLKVQAADGMRIEIVHGGQTITVMVKGGEFLIEDGTGFSMALSGTPATDAP